MSKQTAIDWLVQNLPERFRNAIANECMEEIEKAKDMEWQQICDAHLAGYGHIIRIVSKAVPMDGILKELEELEAGGYYHNGYMYYLETYEGLNQKTNEDEEE